MIDSKVVDRVIELAQLALADDERAQLADELASILAYVDRLRQVTVTGEKSEEGSTAGDAAGGDEPERPGPPATPLREDVVAQPLPREAVLANAPSAEAGLFRLPRLLD